MESVPNPCMLHETFMDLGHFPYILHACYMKNTCMQHVYDISVLKVAFQKSSSFKLQWNLRQLTPPIMETSTMWTRCRGPKTFPIIHVVHCTLRSPYSKNLPTSILLTPQRKQNQCKFPLRNRQSHTRSP